MDGNQKGMRSIWYFVGWLLTIIGILVLIAGFLNLYVAFPEKSATDYVHPDLWWGGLITIVGLFYVLSNRNSYVK